MKILLTGAGGFVGQRFVEVNKETYGIEILSLRNNEWENRSFSGFDAIVHLAGKAHEMKKIDDRIYFEINAELTQKLYLKAIADGVKQFIYISSTKVFGDHPEGKLNEMSPASPDDAYGKSKLAAETFLLSRNDGCAIAIIRPPLVYGPRVKGNMINLLKLCAGKKTLPFKGIANRRSMVYVDNLIALINTIVQKKATGIYIGGDAEPLSTEQLVTLIRKAMGRKPGLFRLPGMAKAIIKKLKPALYTRLFGSYEVDPSNGFKQLGFVPPYSSEQGINETVGWFMKENTTK